MTDSNYRITNDIDLVSDNKNINLNFRKIFEKEFPYFEKNILDQNFLKGKILDKKNRNNQFIIHKQKKYNKN